MSRFLTAALLLSLASWAGAADKPVKDRERTDKTIVADLEKNLEALDKAKDTIDDPEHLEKLIRESRQDRPGLAW